MPSRTEVSERICEILFRNGWELYRRESTSEIERTLAQGPVVGPLKEGVIYEFHSQAIRGMSESQFSAFFRRYKVSMPRVTAPEGVEGVLGRVVAQFSGSDTEERQIRPGEVLEFQGIELLGDEVRLIAESRTYMPTDVFLKALQTLNEITDPPLR